MTRDTSPTTRASAPRYRRFKTRWREAAPLPERIAALVAQMRSPRRNRRPPAEPEPKETCPTCGRTSVFAGPPGQRFCTYCALRDELFDRRAAVQE